MIVSATKPKEEERILLREIISLNRDRILSRLRSRHAIRSARSWKKPSVIRRLADAISAASKLNVVQVVPNGDLEALILETKELAEVFARLEALPAVKARPRAGVELLAEILQRAYRLALRDNLESAINLIPCSGDFGPGTGFSLKTAVGKIGRYQSACRFLIVAARRHNFQAYSG